MRLLIAMLTFGGVLAPPVCADVSPPRPVDDGGPLVITGEAETVFDWTTDRCYELQIPDLPVRAFRDGDGQVNLILSHYTAHPMVGPDFDSLEMDCTGLMGSTLDPDPSQFANHEWIASVYAEEDGVVHALVHNEFQGNRYRDQCPSQEYFRCWYNAITYVRSEDGGASFARPMAPPDHLVASVTDRFVPDEGIFGAFSPSNIIERDGFYYAFLKVQPFPMGWQHVCLMRTDTLSDPDSWRFWDGRAFEGRFADPYRDDLRAMRAQECAPIALPQIAQMHESITWNAALGRFVLIGISNDPSREPNVFGFYYALSEDLITWDHRRPLLEARLPWRAGGNETTYLYPTLIDHTAPGRNFETTGAEAWLYFTRLTYGSGHLDRDLVRMPVSFRVPE